MRLEAPDSDERVFLRVVEAGSLKAAAEQLGNDPSAISRRVAALEDRLGQQLLRRSTRGSRPTEAGARYYQGLASLVAQQDALEAAIAGASDEPVGRLRVTAPPEFGVRFVVPVLEELRDRYRELRFELALGTGFSDLNVEDIDVAIRIGTPRDSALSARRLGQVARIVVAAPRYLAQHGEPRELEELSDHEFLGYRAATGAYSLTATTKNGLTRKVRVDPHFAVNSMPTLSRLVEAGKGICYGPKWAFAEALSSGCVREILTHYAFEAAPIHALYRDRRYQPAKNRAFIGAMAEFLVRQGMTAGQRMP
jgi:DNA-binding transcriptional LysR family regulator